MPYYPALLEAKDAYWNALMKFEWPFAVTVLRLLIRSSAQIYRVAYHPIEEAPEDTMFLKR